MRVRQSGAQVTIETPAKLNLFLEVLGRDHDGYHEIETLMTAISIYDTLYFVAHPAQQVDLTSDWVYGCRNRPDWRMNSGRGSLLGGLPGAGDNIVLKAVDLLRRRVGVPLGARMHLIKRIPSAAGLGGASSDAAAALVAGNLGWNLGLSCDQLLPLAAELGSDVPFFLSGGFAVCRGRGEKVDPMQHWPPMDFVVVRPEDGLATSRVYSRCQPASSPRSIRPLLQDGPRCRSGAWHGLLFNRLQSTASRLSPSIDKLRHEFDRLDVLAHQMSGSGTSYFGICRHARHARRLASYLKARCRGYAFCARTSGSNVKEACRRTPTKENGREDH